MSTVTKSAAAQPSLREMFERPSIVEGVHSALAGYMDARQFLSQMLIAFASEAIQPCTLNSKFEAAHQCAALGLLPSLQQVALIPREIKGKGLCCTVMPQWQGFQALMLRHPDVLSVKAVLVHSKDQYDYDPITEAITHRFDPFDSDRIFKDFADVRGGYLVVRYKDGRQPLYHYVTTETMKKAKACSAGGTIWTKWFYEQCLKTVYRNAYARRVVPIDHLVHAKLQQLQELEDDALDNDPNRVIEVQPAAIVHQPEKPKKSRTQQVAANMAPAPEEVPEQKSEPQVDPPAEPAPELDAVEAVNRIDSCKTTDELTKLIQKITTWGLSSKDMEIVVEAANDKSRQLEGARRGK